MKWSPTGWKAKWITHLGFIEYFKLSLKTHISVGRWDNFIESKTSNKIKYVHDLFFSSIVTNL